MRFRNDHRGLSLLEVIISITLTSAVIGIFSVVLSGMKLQQRSLDQMLALSFAESQLEVIEAMPYESLTDVQEVPFFAFAYNHGNQRISEDALPPSAPNVLKIQPGLALQNDITAISLVAAEVSQDFTYTSFLKVDEDSLDGWSAGPVFLYQDHQNYYQFRFSLFSSEVIKVENGIETLLASGAAFQKDQWYEVTIDYDGQDYTIEVDDTSWGNAADIFPTSGRVGLVSYGSTITLLDSVAVSWPQGSKIFNFDSERVNAFPVGMTRLEPSLNELQTHITIMPYEEQEEMKLITASVIWSGGADEYSVEVNTIKLRPYEPE